MSQGISAPVRIPTVVEFCTTNTYVQNVSKFCTPVYTYHIYSFSQRSLSGKPNSFSLGELLLYGGFCYQQIMNTFMLIGSSNFGEQKLVPFNLRTVYVAGLRGTHPVSVSKPRCSQLIYAHNCHIVMTS